MHLELVALLQPDQEVAVARDQRTLGDDAEGQAFTTGQPLQHRPRDTKPALGRLVGVGLRADHDRLAEWYALQVDVERADDVLFDEDPLFECLPPVRATIVRELGVGQLARIVRALDYVTMRVARVAVTAAEFTADVWIQRPVVHSGRGRWVEHPLGSEGNEPGAA